MSKVTIEVNISKDGVITAQTKGLKGATCIEELEALLADIAEIEKVKKTDEYYQENTTQSRAMNSLKRR